MRGGRWGSSPVAVVAQRKGGSVIAVGLVPRIGFPAARVADGKTGSVKSAVPLLWFFLGLGRCR